MEPVIPTPSFDRLPEGQPLELHPDLAPLAFLVGTWRGGGVGGYPSLERDFAYGQQVTFTHNGNPALAYTSRSWLLDADGNVLGPGAAESGFWRATGDGPDGVELVLAHATGLAEVWVGRADGERVELRTDVVARTATAKEVTAGHRLYGLVDGELMYAYDMAALGHELAPHLSARLRRVDGE